MPRFSMRWCENEIYPMCTLGFCTTRDKRWNYETWSLYRIAGTSVHLPFWRWREGTLLWNVNTSSLGKRREGVFFTNRWLWGERRLCVSLEGSIIWVPIQSSFNPAAKAVCSKSSDHIEMWKYSWSIVSWQVYILEWTSVRWEVWFCCSVI